MYSTQVSGLLLEVNGTLIKASFKSVLESALGPEQRLAFDSRVVAEHSSLIEWHLGRAFTAGLVNSTIHSISSDPKTASWALWHSRAVYLLPYFVVFF